MPRHSWENHKKWDRDDDRATCRRCGLTRWREYMEPTLYRVPMGDQPWKLSGDHRHWNYAPNCPPSPDDPGIVTTIIDGRLVITGERPMAGGRRTQQPATK